MTISSQLRADAGENAPDVVVRRQDAFHYAGDHSRHDAPAMIETVVSSERATTDEPVISGRKPVIPTKEPQRRRATRSFLALSVCCMIASMALVAGRRTVVAFAPTTAGAWARLGLPVNTRGLEWRGVRSRVIEDGQQRVLVVDGEIANLRESANRVPDLLLSVRSDDGRVIYTWTAPPPKQTLAGAEAVYFRARLAAPPAEGRDVKTQFAAANAASPLLRR